MGLIFGGLLALFVALASKAKGNGRQPMTTIHVDMTEPAITRWEPFVQIAAVAASLAMRVDTGLLIRFAMAWLGVESSGNVCAVGELAATAPNGYPREIGLFQIYNPDDFAELGVDPSELVSYCVRPTPGGNNPQKLAHQMTAGQIARHINVGLEFIKRKRAYADHYLSLHGVPWSTTGRDYWRAVKLAHALPVIVNTGLGQVASKLGRAPLSWQEFRSTYETIQPRAKYRPDLAKAGKQQDGYFRALDNAEWTGGQIPDQVIA